MISTVDIPSLEEEGRRAEMSSQEQLGPEVRSIAPRRTEPINGTP